MRKRSRWPKARVRAAALTSAARPTSGSGKSDKSTVTSGRGVLLQRQAELAFPEMAASTIASAASRTRFSSVGVQQQPQGQRGRERNQPEPRRSSGQHHARA